MKNLSLYTNLHRDTETLADVRKRGKTVRFHPDPEAARADSRDEDLIVVLTIHVPADAAFIFYRDTGRGAIIFAQADDFNDAYSAAGKSQEREERLTAVLTRSGGGRLLVPLSDFITGMEYHLEDLAA